MMRPPSSTAHNTTKVPPNAEERLEALKRKLALLESVHADEKKQVNDLSGVFDTIRIFTRLCFLFLRSQHQVDADRLKLDLSKAQKSIADLEKVKKHNAALEARVQELKKTSTSEQAEIRDLRVKLRISENERSQLTSKQGEAGEMKKAMQALESKRKDEMRERDRKVAELEKSLSAEKKRREGAEAKLAEIRGRVDGEVKEAKETAHERESEVKRVRAQAEEARASLESVRREAEITEERLLERLDDVQSLLSHAAEEYGRLASSTVLKSTHHSLKVNLEAVRLRNVHLQRKLANSEGQVVELASLIRQRKEQNEGLSTQLRHAEELISFYHSCWKDSLSDRQASDPPNDPLWAELLTLQSDQQEMAATTYETVSSTETIVVNAYRSSTRVILSSLAASVHEVDMERLRTEQSNTALENVKAARDVANSESDNLRSEHGVLRKQISDLKDSLDSAKAQEADLLQKVKAAKLEAQWHATEHEQSVWKERDINQRLTQTVQKHKAAEDALRAEIEQ